MYNIPSTEFLNYMSLVASIPVPWKNRLKHESCPNELEFRDNLLYNLVKSKQKTHFLYNFQLKNTLQLQTTSSIKWENELLDEELEWKKIFLNAVKTT